MRLIQFFAEGQPIYDKPEVLEENQIGEWPNSWESDLEKVPAMKIKVEVLDSMICLDSFDVEDLIDVNMNKAFFESQQMSSLYISERQTVMGQSRPIGESIYLSAQENEQVNLTTIVCRCEKIDYSFQRK